jgi:hypothetical protein
MGMRIRGDDGGDDDDGPQVQVGLRPALVCARAIDESKTVAAKRRPARQEETGEARRPSEVWTHDNAMQIAMAQWERPRAPGRDEGLMQRGGQQAYTDGNLDSQILAKSTTRMGEVMIRIPLLPLMMSFQGLDCPVPAADGWLAG